MNLSKWWERFPERLAFELESLEQAGIAHERDDEAWDRGIYRLRLEMDVLGQRLSLFVTFPDLYPYFRFEVDAQSLSLRYHQNPFEKNLCLLGRGTHNWETTNTVASLLLTQLEDVLRTGASDDREVARGVEQQQAEPFSDYYPYLPSMVVLQGEQRLPESHQSGTFVLSTSGPQGPVPQGLVHGALSEVRGENGELLAQNDANLLTAFPDGTLEGRWYRCDAPIARGDAGEFLKELLRRYPTSRQATANHVAGGWLQIWAVVFPEEGTWRNKDSTGWVFVSLFSRQRSQLLDVSGRRQKPQSKSEKRRKSGKKR